MTSIPTTTRQWVLREKPADFPVLEGNHATFQLTTLPLPSIEASQILVKTLYFSNDPAQRGWISANADPKRLYVPPIQVGAAMGSGAIAKVIKSGSPEALPPGTLVVAMTGWTEYSVHDIKECQVIQPLPGLRVTHFLGSFGLPGLTAYYALTEIVKVTKDDTIVVSGAAGATGSMAIQIAKKLVGCKRVGFAHCVMKTS